MKKIFILCAFLSLSTTIFAQIESDVQFGFVFSNLHESYTSGDTDFSSKTNRIGIELANYNYFYDAWFGFFEDVDVQFKRWGVFNNGKKDISYDDTSFYAYDIMFGPTFRLRNQPEMETRFSLGFHYFAQSYKDSTDVEIRDSSIGIGAIVDQKMFTYGAFSLVLGAKAYWDFKDSKSRIINGNANTGNLSNYRMFALQPHILFTFNF
ncbi:MAG: hypothetical protein K6E51_13230 [Treponema sp.]|nr:hypothetical protein [Treponema sp.]